ncbi:hypothetical protein ACFX15_020735 [Malus domestica]
MLPPRNQNRLYERRPAASFSECVFFLIANEQNHLLFADNGDVVVRLWLRFAVEFGGLEVPDDVHGDAVHRELLGALLAPEVPRLELNFAPVLFVSVLALHRNREAVE